MLLQCHTKVMLSSYAIRSLCYGSVINKVDSVNQSLSFTLFEAEIKKAMSSMVLDKRFSLIFSSCHLQSISIKQSLFFFALLRPS